MRDTATDAPATSPSATPADTAADLEAVLQEEAREGADAAAPALQSPLRRNDLNPLTGRIRRAYSLPLSETLTNAARKAGRILLQLGLILAICLAGDQVSALLPVDVPGNICSMVLLLAFLLGGVIRMENIADAANFLLDNMAVFFVPAAVAIMGSVDLLAGNILKLVLICLITTVLVFFVTSFTVSTVANLMARREARADQTVENQTVEKGC